MRAAVVIALDCLGVPLHLIVFDAAGKVVEAGKTGDWDIALPQMNKWT